MKVSASGKIILCGEHAVVYGSPALAVGIPQAHIQAQFNVTEHVKNIQWTLSSQERSVALSDEMISQLSQAWRLAQEIVGVESPAGHIELHSTIPVGAGMGSSAALSLVLIRLCYLMKGVPPQELSYETQIEQANKIDHLFHGTASGLDVSACAAEGRVIRFKKGCPIEFVTLKRPLKIIILDSRERAATSKMVGLVKQLKLERPAFFEETMETLVQNSVSAEDFMKRGQLESLGAVFKSAHRALAALGLVTPRCQQLCDLLLSHGALGAKMTGAGGGGCVLGLFSEETQVSREILDLPDCFECVVG